MADVGNFNAAEVEPATGGALLPPGDYEVAIVNEREKEARSGRGSYLELEFQVLAGPHANRRLWKILNLWNDNVQAVEIARGELSAICRAAGVLTIRDTRELHGHPMLATVKVKRDDKYGDKNEIVGVKKLPPTGQRSKAPADDIPF